MAAAEPSPFGALLRHHRVEAGLTQDVLAGQAHLSTRVISDLERGVPRVPRPDTVRRIADALNLTGSVRSDFTDSVRPQLRALSRSPTSSAPSIDDRPAQGTDVRTFLIVDIRGYTPFTVERGNAAAARLTTKFAVQVRECVSARCGEVIELRGDEALAVFESARQALQAAVELQDHLRKETASDRDLPLPAGIGLDAGEAIPVEGGYRGSPLNLAARLCSLAGPGEVLASDTVVNVAGTIDVLEYVERGMVQLKGFATPVKVIQVVPETERQSVMQDRPLPGAVLVDKIGEQRLLIGGFLGSLPSGTLVARERELNCLLTGVDAAAHGDGRLVVLAGEPGIGKTRLAQEATLVAKKRGFLVATGRCYEPQQLVPFYPFLEALGVAFAVAPSRVRLEAPRRWPYLSRLLPEEFGFRVLPSSGSPEEQHQLLRAVTSFVQAIAEEVPLAILLDDLHWADTASVDLLQELARHMRGSHVLLVATCREPEIHHHDALRAAIRDLDREHLVDRVSIRRLGKEETAALIKEIVGDVSSAVDFVNLVHERTEGNPFFTQQVLRSLVESGAVYRHDGRWDRHAVEEMEVPETVRLVIGQRVSRLEARARDVLHEASVLGQSFAFDALLELNARSESEVDAALEAATDVGLVRIVDNDNYAFDHVLTQNTLYAALSPRKQKRLHCAAGEVLEKLPNPQQKQRAAELAQHFLQGGVPERALPWVIQAGDQAEAVFAHEEAEHQYRTAADLARELGDGVQEAQALERVGVVLRITGRLEESLAVLDRVCRTYRAAKDLEGEGRVTAQIGLVHLARGTLEEGLSRLRPVVQELEERGPSRSLARLYATLPRLYRDTDRVEEQLAATERLMELARGFNDEHLLVEAHMHRGVSLLSLGRVDEALQALESAITGAEAVGDFATACTSLDMAARIHHGAQKIDTAWAYRERAVELARRLGDPRDISYREVEAALVAFLLGDWNQCRAYAEQSLTTALSVDILRAYVLPLLLLGELSLHQGEWDHAVGYLEECMTIAKHINYDKARREVHALLAEKDLIAGEADAAYARLGPLLTTSGWDDHVNFLLPLAWASMATGHETLAHDAVTKARAKVDHDSVPVGRVDVLRVEGMLAAQHKRWNEAEFCLGQAISVAQKFLYPWGEARARYEQGRIFAQMGKPNQARVHLEEALTIFERLGARPHVARAEMVVRALDMSTST
ncbi:MAG: hypothetical protein NVSMB22_19450 [Chloroflexota bacterium]